MNIWAAMMVQSEGMLHPLLLYALLSTGLGLCLYLFTSLKAEIRALVKRATEDRSQLQALAVALAEARDALDRVAGNLRDVEGQTGMLVPPAPIRSGLNLSKRTQVLRKHRAGEDPAAIAAALELPRAEVDLLIKVQRLALEQVTPGA
jgi:hypothetical protein